MFWIEFMSAVLFHLICLYLTTDILPLLFQILALSVGEIHYWFFLRWFTSSYRYLLGILCQEFSWLLCIFHLFYSISLLALLAICSLIYLHNFCLSILGGLTFISKMLVWRAGILVMGLSPFLRQKQRDPSGISINFFDFEWIGLRNSFLLNFCHSFYWTQVIWILLQLLAKIISRILFCDMEMFILLNFKPF